MTKPEFELQIERLKREYDPHGKFNVYGPEKVRAIYTSFQAMPLGQFQKLIDRVFQGEHKAPLARDLLRIQEDLRKETHYESKIAFQDTSPTDPLTPEQTQQKLRLVRMLVNGVKEIPEEEGA